MLLEKRESLVMMAKLFGPAQELRSNNPRVIPEVYFLAQLALENMGLRNDLIVIEDAEGYAIGNRLSG